MIPLGSWADRQLTAFFALARRPVPSEMDGADLMLERAAINDFAVPGRSSTGGACRLLSARDGGWVALNLARADDRDMLPALFEDGALDPQDDDAIAAHVAVCDAAVLIQRGREFGMAIASLDERPVSPALTVTSEGTTRATPGAHAPLVIDLSALWAGPLAAHLLWQAGAQVIKVESVGRPDAMRDGDPGLFTLLNQGKANVTLDLRDNAGRDALLALIGRADIVIEAARPRAFRQLGLDADALVERFPGLLWTTITGHGVAGDAANWVGFGDDCGVAGGVSAALREASGQIGFGGDAVGDPLTGLATANAISQRWSQGRGGRLILSMSGIVAAALAEERRIDPIGLAHSLRNWAATVGQPIASLYARGPVRTPRAPVAHRGQDNDAWLALGQR